MSQKTRGFSTFVENTILKKPQGVKLTLSTKPAKVYAAPLN